MRTAQESIARTFYQTFTKEILHHAREANATKYSKDLDGFTLTNIKDGWVEFRGLAFGFAFLEDPPRITLTFGPDGPFVGYQQVFDIYGEGDTVKCVLQEDESFLFECPSELAKFGLNTLVGKLHERNVIE
jgi:hypothetical protein